MSSAHAGETRCVPLGEFDLQGALGSGAMATVYGGLHRPSQMPVAIKVLSADHADPASREAFRREVQTAAALRHPHIVPVLDHGTVPAGTPGLAADAPYLVMSRAESSLLQVSRRLAWPAISRLLFELLDALAHAHARGVVHCDLKPENVLLLRGADGVVPALTDFGVAHAFRAVDATIGITRVRGTPQFMAPEQFVSPRDIGPATDLYALACMTYEMVCRRLPFEGQSALALGVAHVRGPRPALVPAMPVPAGLAAWIERLLCPDWRGRFAGAAEAAAALARFAPMGAALPATGDPGEPAATVDVASLPTVPMQIPLDAPVASAPPVAALRAPLAPTWRRRVEPPAPSLAGVGLFGLRSAPFVAREEERDQLWALLRAVHTEGGVRVAVLRGAAGTGKSRLAEWVAQRADEVGGARLFFTHHAAVSTSAHGISGLLRRVIRSTGGDDLVRVCRLRGKDSPEARDGFILVEAGLSGGGSQPPVRRHRAVLDWLAAVAHPRPMLLWLDDCHWDRDSLDLVLTLLAQADLPALVLAVVRDGDPVDPAVAERLGRIEADPRTEVLPIAPLSRDAHTELVRGLLPLAPATVAGVVARTEGHPLFAVQLVGAWGDQGLLQPGPDGLAPPPEAADVLPDDIHALWCRRLDEAARRLGADAPRALELAAVLGSDVDMDDWKGVSASAGVTADAVLADALQRLGLIRRTPDGFAFTHRLLWESTLRLAAEGGRLAEHHARCARVLGRRPRGFGAGARIADHWLAAGQPAQAVQPMLSAARQFSAHHHNPAAEALLDRLDAVLDGLGATADDPRRMQAELLRIMPSFAEGDLSALDRLDAVEAAARRHGLAIELGTIQRLRGEIARTQGAWAEADDHLRAAEHRLRAVGELEQAGRAALGQVFLRQREGDLVGAMEALRRAVADFRGCQEGRWLLTARYEQGRLLFHTGDLEAAVEVAEEVIAGALRVGDETNQARALVLRADVDRVRERLGPAEVAYRDSAAIYRRLHNVNYLLMEGELAGIALMRGRYPEAARLAAACQAALAPTPYARMFWPLPLIRAVQAAADGHREEARALIDEGLADADRTLSATRAYVHLAERAAVALHGLGALDLAHAVATRVRHFYESLGDVLAALRAAALEEDAHS
ncbi:MAG: protein kinase [bacterium]